MNLNKYCKKTYLYTYAKIKTKKNISTLTQKQLKDIQKYVKRYSRSLN